MPLRLLYQPVPVSNRSPNVGAVILLFPAVPPWALQVPHSPWSGMETIDLRLYKYNPSFVLSRCLTGQRQCAYLVGNEPALVRPHPAITSRASPCDLVSRAYHLFAQLDYCRQFPCWNACRGEGQVRRRGATRWVCTILNSCPTKFADAPVIITSDLRRCGSVLRTHSDTTNTRLAASSLVFFAPPPPSPAAPVCTCQW